MSETGTAFPRLNTDLSTEHSPCVTESRLGMLGRYVGEDRLRYRVLQSLTSANRVEQIVARRCVSKQPQDHAKPYFGSLVALQFDCYDRSALA